jgi:hypothetical protein
MGYKELEDMCNKMDKIVQATSKEGLKDNHHLFRLSNHLVKYA